MAYKFLVQEPSKSRNSETVGAKTTAAEEKILKFSLNFQHDHGR